MKAKKGADARASIELEVEMEFELVLPVSSVPNAHPYPDVEHSAPVRIFMVRLEEAIRRVAGTGDGPDGERYQVTTWSLLIRPSSRAALPSPGGAAFAALKQGQHRDRIPR
jgi:hypothetical protein